MNIQTSYLTSFDRKQLHLISSIVEHEKAKLLLIHGYAEHSARYYHFIEALNEQGISFYSFDLRGHGKSEGLRAYIRRMEDVFSDVDSVIKHYNLSGNTFLMGHSLGGLIATQYTVTRDQTQFNGLITSGAALAIDPNLSPFLQKLAPILGAILPKLKTEKLDVSTLTRSPEVLQAYESDPMVYREGTRARTGAEMLKAIRETGAAVEKITIPLLAMHGSEDRTTMPSGTEHLFAKARSVDKQLKIYEGLFHELVNEPERDQVIQDIHTWILERS